MEAQQISPASPLAASSAPPLDVKALLTRCMGNSALVCRLLDKFQTQVQDNLQQLRNSVASANCAAFTALAHTLKGSAASLSAEGVRQVAWELEQAGRQGQIGQTEEPLRRLKEQIDQCLAYVPRAKRLAAEEKPDP
jgi:HPt (histidine-containing phosphotransfer) domain-containing protein